MSLSGPVEVLRGGMRGSEAGGSVEERGGGGQSR